MTERQPLPTGELTLGNHPGLLVVDASRGFTDPESALGANFDVELAHVNTLCALADTHRWPCFFSTVSYDSDRQAAVFRQKIPALNALTADSHWIQIDERLNRRAQDTVFTKTHASCFFDTKLHSMLKSAGVDSLIICGFTTSGCVRATVVDALQHDFPALVIREAVGDRDPAAHEANLYDMQAKYAQVISIDNLKAAL